MNVVNKTLFVTLLCLMVQGCDYFNQLISKTGKSGMTTSQPLDSATKNEKSSEEQKGSGGATDGQPASPPAAESRDSTLTDTAKEPPLSNASTGNEGENTAPGPLTFQVKYYYRHKDERGYFKELSADSQLFSKDLYSIKITPETDGYLYVYQVGGDSKIQDLMEQSGRHNKVLKNRRYSLPSETEAFFLDDVPGMETIYVLGFKQRYKPLEDQYSALSQAYADGNENRAKQHQAEMLKILRQNPKPQSLSFKHEKNPTQEKSP